MKPTKPELRLARRADVDAFYGRRIEHTMRGYVVMLEDRPVALGGITYRCGVLCAFSEIKDEFRPYKVSIMKFSRKIGELLKHAPGVAIASPREQGAGRFLEWLGFEHVASCGDGEVYQWRK